MLVSTPGERSNTPENFSYGPYLAFDKFKVTWLNEVRKCMPVLLIELHSRGRKVALFYKYFSGDIKSTFLDSIIFSGEFFVFFFFVKS